jgi:hypothetical protein
VEPIGAIILAVFAMMAFYKMINLEHVIFAHINALLVILLSKIAWFALQIVRMLPIVSAQQDIMMMVPLQPVGNALRDAKNANLMRIIVYSVQTLGKILHFASARLVNMMTM